MQFPSFFGINKMTDLIVRKYNQDLMDIRNWWNDHNAGARFWDNINTNEFSTQVVSKTSAYTAAGADVVILVDSTGGAVTITLPTAVNIKGRWYLIKDWKGQAATNNITIATTSSQTIDGGTSKVLKQNYLSYLVVSDGANWVVMSAQNFSQISNVSSYVATFSAGWGNVTQQSLHYRRSGNWLQVWGVFQCGVTAASVGTITLPSGSVLDTANLSNSSTRDFLGWWFAHTTAATILTSARMGVWFYDGTNNDRVEFSFQTSNQVFNPDNVNALFGNSTWVTVFIEAPVV